VVFSVCRGGGVALRHNSLGVHDLLLVVGLIAAGRGYFYPAMGAFLAWGWLNKRRTLMEAAEQHPRRVGPPDHP
jgi:hypothetical protein